MDFMTAFDVGASALTAERTHLNVISMNLANAKTTKTAEGGAYRRKSVSFAATEVSPFGKAMNDALDREIKGVRVLDIAQDKRPFKKVYEPGHPDADKEGYVSYPDINIVEEMTNMLTASRSYEANAQGIETAKNMYARALELGR